MREVIQKAREKGLEGVVFDLDGTAYKNSFAKSIGYEFLKREAGNFHLGNVLNGLYGALKINLQALNWNEHDERNAKGVKTLFEALGRIKCADRNYAYYLARQHMANNEIDGLGNFLNDCRINLGPAFIATEECDIAPDAISEAYPIDGWSAYPVTYKTKSGEISADPIVFRKNDKWQGKSVITGNPIISGCKTENRKSKEQVQKLLHEAAGLNLSDVLAVGDSMPDLPILEDAGLAASSPLAVKEIRNNKKIYHIRSYLD